MATHKNIKMVPCIAAITVVIAQIGVFLFGENVKKVEAKSQDDNGSQRAHAQVANPLCTPIFGTGKSVGIPIVAKTAGNSVITDLSPYTFELTDGSTTQDVTTLIKSPQQEPLVTGQTMTSNGYTFKKLGVQFYGFGVSSNASPPTLDFTNPGYFFLDCTPDGSSPAVKFASGITLKMKESGTVVASVSLSGRSASFLGEQSAVAQNPALAVYPAGGSHLDFQQLYRDFITNVGVRFRPAFAQIAVMEMSNNYANTTYCWDDLTTTSGGSWAWSSTGQNFVNELTASSGNNFPILDARTKGTAGPHSGAQYPCGMSYSIYEDDFFINFLTAQLMLIDGPLGNVPAGIRSSVDAFQPASVLQLAAVATTTTIAATTTTVRATTTLAPTTTSASGTTKAALTQSEEAPMPTTGSDSSKWALIGAILVAIGVAVMRRRRTVK